MNFFESQDRARKHTGLLVALFALAVLGLVIITNVLVMVVFGYINSEQLGEAAVLPQTFDWATFAAIGLGVSAVVLAGSAYKIMSLSAGGKVVAESLGGQLIPQDTQNPDHRKLLNVVEEISIASGTPAPPVYLLVNEPGINAFAAGLSPRDAVVAVTEGAIQHLNREQLQGVIAHEFSHIFNGDMRLNIRLMGALHGILILGILGYYLLYSSSFSGRRRGNDKNAAAILALAIGLMVIGYAGTFFGALIKASVSRQREYLADATSVQFTRNPNGIAGALKRIGGLKFGSKVENPGATEVSHAFFAQGVSGFMQGLAATHPPLSKRILRIDPQWDGKFDTSDQAEPARHESPTANTQTTAPPIDDKLTAIATGVAVGEAMTAINQFGQPQQANIDYAQTLLAALPVAIAEAAREPYGARAVIYGLVLDQAQSVRAKQLQHLQEHADAGVHALTLSLLPQLHDLDEQYRLPLISLAMPALKQLSGNQYTAFRANLLALIEMDGKVDLLEWSLQKIVFQHLDQQFLESTPVKARYSEPSQLKPEMAVMLSAMAHAGAQNQGDKESAFATAASSLGLGDLALLTDDQIKPADLDRALQKLEQLQPLAKSKLLKACAASIAYDQKILPLEAELLRAFASVLDCPLPTAMSWLDALRKTDET